MGYSAGFSYALRAKAQDFIIRYGPLRRILLCTMGHSAGFCYALWAKAPNRGAEPESLAAFFTWKVK
jgi:hypothetical protein